MDAELPTTDGGADLEATHGVPVKVCPRCSVQSQTAGNFCPRCPAAYNGPEPRSKISKRIVIGMATLVVVGSATGLAVKISHANQATAQRVAAAQAQKRAADAVEAKATATPAKAEAEAAATAALGSNDPATLEEEITTKLNESMAEEPELKGVTVKSVTCVPSGEHLFDCSVRLSNDFNAVHTYLVAADGQSWVSKAGQN